MDWWRSHHGAPMHPKWQVIARRSRQPVALVVTVVWQLLDHASRAADRGNVSHFDAEQSAVYLGCEESDVQSVVDALSAKGWIVDGRIASWSERQPAREDRTAVERKRRQRDAAEQSVTKRDMSVTERDIAGQNASSQNVTTEQSRTEQSRVEESLTCASASAPAPAHARADWPLAAACNRTIADCWAQPVPRPLPREVADIERQWREAGATVALVERIVKAKAEAMQAGGEGRMPSVKYFTEPIIEAARRERAEATAGDREAMQWRARLDGWRSDRTWFANLWGPKPGEPGCRVPAALLVERAA